MKIGLDIDDTLTNTKEQQIIYWQEYYKNNPRNGYSKTLPSTINDFGDEYIQTFWDTYRTPLSFDSTFKVNAAKIITKLRKEGHIICIVTSRPDEKYPNLHKHLKDWFKKNNIIVDFIYTNIRNKGLFCHQKNIEIFIDDDIKHIKSANNYHIKTILFNKNKSYNGYQTTNWLELYKIIKKIEKEELDQ